MVYWRQVERSQPEDPTNPEDPAYDWDSTDLAVRIAYSEGVEPTLLAFGAPPWAEGPHRPAEIVPGVWDPDPVRYGQFAEALARRYSGTAGDLNLPHVTTYQAWNEPNLDIDLAPQWRRKGAGWDVASPGIYRDLLNAFYAGVKRVDPSAVVLTAGTAPFGDPLPGGHRLAPARFWRELLCLSNSLTKQACPEASHFDAIDHHPYSIGEPTRKALNPDDVSIPDLAKITRPVARAVAVGTALPRSKKPLWITEVSWDSSPPDPEGVPEIRRSFWVQQMLYLLWKQGAETVTWFLIRDQLPDPSFASTYQSGMYTFDGTAKRALNAFRFPALVTWRHHGSSHVWLRAPSSGWLVLERRGRTHWLPVARARASAGKIRRLVIAVPDNSLLRARVNQASSLPFSAAPRH